MATMVKEKRKERKRERDKQSSQSSEIRDLSPVAIAPLTLEDIDNLNEDTQLTIASETNTQTSKYINTQETFVQEISTQESTEDVVEVQSQQTISIQESCSKSQTTETLLTHSEYNTQETTKEVASLEFEGSYLDLKSKLERLAIPKEITAVSDHRQEKLEHPSAYLVSEQCEDVVDILPTAPCIEEIPELPREEPVVETRVKLKCMPIEDAMNLLGGKEMEEVRVLSEREEQLIDADSVDPQHPLIDLLSTLRFSLIALERERLNVDTSLAEEEKLRSQLWLIEKRNVYVSEKCTCGSKVEVRATYEHAEFLKHKLPRSVFQAEKLLKDVQESYCHYQHAVLLAHYQIEELISETIKSNKAAIRDALTLILEALRLSDTAPVVLVSALQRWASALASALLDERDVRQILFLLHHLFRQYRSVQWAARVLHVSVDAMSVPRVLALLQLLLARPGLEPAVECTEESEEAWEEVDTDGEGGAVSEGSLRERDLLALLHAFPLRDLLTRVTLFNHNDIKKARPHEWGDRTGGHGVLRSCYGVRTLLHVLRAATNKHARYERLREVLRDIAASALHALANLHLVSRSFYESSIQDKITAELEACFSSGCELFGSEVYKLNANLLSDHTASDYCVANIVALHDKSPKELDFLGIEMPALGCDVRVRIVTQVAVDRQDHSDLARFVLDFLLQTGIKRKSPVFCKGGCEAMARECIPKFLEAHPYLHTIALHIVADLNMVDSLDPECINTLHAFTVAHRADPLFVRAWRPHVSDVSAVLDDWSVRCVVLLQQLLSQLDYTPHSGLSLDVQLTIGSWLCTFAARSPTPPEWTWRVLRKLRVHRTLWGSGEAPPPGEVPSDLFSTAYALLAYSWGHSIPVICSEGVEGLHRVSLSRPREAVHCLAGIMLVMAHSPESIAFTPKFSEVITAILNSGPTLVQRALWKGGASGSELLLRLILAQLESKYEGDVPRGAVLSAWLHVLHRAGGGGATVADTAATATRMWPQLDAFCTSLLMGDKWKEQVSHSVRHVSTAPLLCECTLRNTHALREARSAALARLSAALYRQHAQGRRIHVDNALAQVAPNMSSEDLVIYRTAAAALTAPMSHPSHLTLWRLFMHLYLQRDNESLEASPPIGCLFFSGLMKSRTLTQLKRRLQETITYHHNEIVSLKSRNVSKSINIRTAVPTSTVKSNSLDDRCLLPQLSIKDLVESSDLSDSDDSSDEDLEEVEDSNSEGVSNDVSSLISYHTASEKLLSEYASWLDEGEKVRAMPHHADIARFLQEHALESAWRNAVSRPPSCPDLDSFPLPMPVQSNDRPLLTPFHSAVDVILSIKGNKKYKTPQIKSPLEDVNVNNANALLKVVDRKLKDIENLAYEWRNEVKQVSSLHSRVWRLVSVLRVSRAAPPVRKQCPNKCRMFTLVIPAQEWCISEDAAKEVVENVRATRSALRRLARPRPLAARAAAALHAAVRCSRSSETAVRMLERVHHSAGALACPPTRALIHSLAQMLAERWVWHECLVCARLVRAWGVGTELQQQLCGTLLEPRRLPHHDWPPVYIALLQSKLPSHTLFSYLSKFDMSSWSSTADPTQRYNILYELLASVQRWGPTPGDDNMLVELLGMHTAAILDAHDMCAYVLQCARATVRYKLPPAHWTHVARAVDLHAKDVPFDQLGHLLRELGAIWWEVRTNNSQRDSPYGTYAQYYGHVLCALVRAFAVAATELSYASDRVSWSVWSGLVEAWGPWICAHADSAPLLSATGGPGAPGAQAEDYYTNMLKMFVDCILAVMTSCPGGETQLLQLIFDWCIRTYLGVQGIRSAVSTDYTYQEGLVQASAMLVALGRLPWDQHQWFYGNCIQQAVQISTSPDRELTTWCSHRWQHTTAHTLLSDVPDGGIVPRLATLLYLFTGTHLHNSKQLLEQACHLPWARLPEPALDEALDRFFKVHHNPTLPYHDLPQFRLILVASGLSPVGGAVHSPSTPRRLAAAQWVRGATQPTLAGHAAPFALRLLTVISELVPYLGESKDEIEALLNRAIMIMGIEPAATAALPVWLNWVSNASPRLVCASVSAAATLTVFEYFATFGDAAVHSLLNCDSPAGWAEVRARWRPSPWQCSAALVQRARLHAAYACVVTHTHGARDLRDTLANLITADVNFVDLEAIASVWICVACRVACTMSDRAPDSTSDSAPDTVECVSAARTLLHRWGTPPRRSILSVVTLSAQADRPTDRHSLLCRYAECILSPSEDTRKTFDASCAAILGATNDVTSWALAPTLSKLVRLALRLYPKHTKYFEYELSLSKE